MKEVMEAYGELCKIRISAFSALSATTGFVLAASGVKPQLLILAFGIFLLACGSGALNQYQERDTDALMERTRARPLPSGRLLPRSALRFSLMLILVGSSFLLLTGSLPAVALGLSAVLWYNGVYTLLKRKTAFAVVPGALIGAIPPAIGWVAGGGRPEDPRLLVLCFFFFMWQIPHFWLFALNHGDDYGNAGLPSLTAVFSRPQLQRIVFTWVAATSVSSLFLFAGGTVRSPVLIVLILALSAWLFWNGTTLLRDRRDEFICPFAFRRINVYMFIVMVSLTLDRLLGGS
jgi:protoheme IX farnesyltransferase